MARTPPDVVAPQESGQKDESLQQNGGSSTPAAVADANAETKAEAKVEAKEEAKLDAKAEAKAEAKAKTKADAKAKAKADAKAKEKGGKFKSSPPETRRRTKRSDGLIDVFRRGPGVVYRIPSLVWVPTKKAGDNHSGGRLLAFAEQRDSPRDYGNISIAQRISTDGGNTWSDTRRLFGPRQVGIQRPTATIGNPTAVFDAHTRKVVLLFVVQYAHEREYFISKGRSNGSRWIFTSHSSDGGNTWSRPKNITRSVKPRAWTWYATGPGAAIQMTAPGPFQGRLVAPCNHLDPSRKPPNKRSHLIYSDNGGELWRLGARMAWNTNECTVAELSNGTLLINSRDWSKRNTRVQHISHDGGISTSGLPHFKTQLNEPKPHGCHAGMLAVADGGPSSLLLFSNPASAKRRNLTLKVSNTDGRRWKVAQVLHAGPAGYSAMTVVPSAADFSVACLFECGKQNYFDGIALAVVPGSMLQAALQGPAPSG